ncbi:MAG: MBOAT family O-acyltransferase [Roseburia sp.]
MTFASISFLVFFAVILLVLAVLDKITGKNEKRYRTISQIVLLVGSYFFYGWWNAKFCMLLAFVTVVSYGMALGMERSREHKKIWLGIGVCIPLLVLGYFKYYNFFVESFCNVFGVKNTMAIEVILPVGISFYTFQAMSYLIDVYRKELAVRKNFVHYALYISFFPQLVAGPIVKAKEFLPQLEEIRKISLKRLEAGIQIFLFGLFKKVVIADNLSVFVDDVYRVPGAYSTISVWLAVISYSIQIYCDFSGYSDMAVGCATCMGYDLPRNFNLPYLSKNVSEFWKRWHISLSTWLQQYLYIPLGGNRKGQLKMYRNLFLTMVLGGLWHGASWTFVVWGALHGLALCIHKAFRKWKPKQSENVVTGVMSIAVTFTFVSVCWIFFRATDFANALEVLKHLVPGCVGITKFYSFSIMAILILLIASGFAIVRSKRKRERAEGFYPILDLSKFWSLVLLWLVVGFILGLGYVEGSPFIYFAF